MRTILSLLGFSILNILTFLSGRLHLLKGFSLVPQMFTEQILLTTCCRKIGDLNNILTPDSL